MDLSIVKELASIMKLEGLSALEVEEKGFRVRLENDVSGLSSSSTPAPFPVSDSGTAAPSPETDTSKPAAESSGENDIIITSPMVGIFYPPEKAGKPPLSAGDKIETGAVVCAIEAMKMMCEIEAEQTGEFVEFLCTEGEQVEFGQPIARLR